jgi:hypothetical protein
MRVLANVPIIEVNDSFDGYSYADNKAKKEKRVKKPLFKEDGFFSTTKREERKAKRLANKKPKKNARKLFSKKDKAGEEKFFYPLSKLFKKEGKWFKKERDGSDSEVKPENVVTTDPNFRFFNVKPTTPIAVDKTEIQKVSGGGAVNWQMALMQGMERLKDAQSKGVLPMPVADEKVTITDDGAFLDDEIQDKDKPLKDVKNDEKNTLTKTQKYLIWGLGAVAVGIIGYAIYRYASKGKTN